MTKDTTIPSDEELSANGAEQKIATSVNTKLDIHATPVNGLAPNEEELFQDYFGKWLEAHGVRLFAYLPSDKSFDATINLNTLKTAILELNATALHEAEVRARIDELLQRPIKIWFDYDRNRLATLSAEKEKKV